ncbi:MAG: trehalose-6-phosphate synthase [Syntrophaceae bacterium]
MKRVLIFFLPVIVIVSIVFAAIGVYQARTVEKNLFAEIKTRAATVAESMDLSAAHILISEDGRRAKRLVERFDASEMRGCVLYDDKGDIIAVTQRISDWKEKNRDGLKKILETRKGQGEIIEFKKYSVFSYIHPVLDDEGGVLGLVEVIYDTSPVFSRLSEVWKITAFSLGFFLLLTLAISLLAHRQLYVVPVKRLTDWFQHFQKGQTDTGPPSVETHGELGLLASEVEQVALQLRVARKSIIEEAQEKVEKNGLWTEGRLRELVQARFGESSLIVVSNREPYLHVVREDGEAECTWPASGVVTAIDPVMRACGGTWIAHGSGNADRQFVNSRDKLGAPPGNEQYILKRVWLSKDEEEGYYYGFSNEGLWPLCHITHTRPTFREQDWQTYRKVNEKFARSVVEEMPYNDPVVFIQDYHFTMLPQMIKELRPDATVALFWHIPWPNPEVFSICPYGNEILKGMLGCDLIGFHVQWHCNNFLDTANRLLECRVDSERFSVVQGGMETLVRTYPISVDQELFGTDGEGLETEKERITRKLKLEDKIVAVSVERIDYTKGILERLLAIDRFLEKYPQFREKFVFIQIASPSRTHIKTYHDLLDEIDEKVERINWKYSTGDWKPILHFQRQFSPEEIKPYYKTADLCIVSSLHDGMNLVAKEFITAKTDNSGVLILSRFTGAARELSDAVQINPYAIEEFADSIRYAIEMPEHEKKRRMDSMRSIVIQQNIYSWAGNIISDLSTVKKVYKSELYARAGG